MLELNGPFLINYYRVCPQKKTLKCKNNSKLIFQDEEDGSIKYRAEMNEFGWAKVANMLYIDNPVGAGYSYSTPQGLPNNQVWRRKSNWKYCGTCEKGVIVGMKCSKCFEKS